MTILGRLHLCGSLRLSGVRAAILILLLASVATAGPIEVLVEGAGCRTRQLAMIRIWSKLEGVRQVTVLDREHAPAANHRFFVIRSVGEAPTKRELVEALGRRAKHYHLKHVAPLAKERREAMERL